MSIALARKFRPRTFADVAVQSHVATTLQGAIARGRVAHGYLLCGPRGVGKTTLARVLAMALNCENGAPGGEPCTTCSSCMRIWSGSASLDVVEIDAASNRGVDDARELRERAMYAPSGDDRYKVYIVDEAHMLTREAWNALLKVLEEPPPRVVFVFATTEPQKIAQAAAPVLSRLQRFDFRRIGAGDIRIRLERVLREEGFEADPEAIAMLARAADGSMRDALSLADQVISSGDGRVTAGRVRAALGLVPEDEYLAVLDLVAERRAGDVFALVGRLADAGIDFSGFLAGLGDMVRAQLAVVLGGAAGDVSDGARERLVQGSARFAAGDLLRMLQLLSELEPRFRKSAQQQLLLETLLVRFALLDRAVALEDVLRGIGTGQAGGGTSPRPAPPAMRAAPPVVERELRAPAPAEPPRGVPADMWMDDGPPVDDAPHPADTMDDRRPTRRAGAPDVNAVSAVWDDIVAAARLGGKTLLAAALEHAAPAVVTAQGVVTVELDEPNDIFAQALEAGRGDLLTALQEALPSVTRIELRGGKPAPAGPVKRISDADIRRDRLAKLRKHDPVLGAAIDALDLDLMD